MGKLTSAVENNEAKDVVVVKKKGSMERKEKNGKKVKKVEATNVGGVKKASKSPKKVEKKIKKSIKEGGKKVGGVKSDNGNAGSSKVNTRKRHQQLKKTKKPTDDDDEDDEAMEVDNHKDDTDYQPESDEASDSDSSTAVDVEEEDDDESSSSSEMSEDSDDEEKTNEVEVAVVAPTKKLTKKSERISAAAAAAAVAPKGDKNGVKTVKMYAEPDSLSKLDSINMSVEEQKAIFVKTNWQVSDVLDVISFNVDQWQDANPSPGAYFFGADKVSVTSVFFFHFFFLKLMFSPLPLFAVHLPQLDNHEKIHGKFKEGRQRFYRPPVCSHGERGVQKPSSQDRHIGDKTHSKSRRTGGLAGLLHLQRAGNKK